MWPCKPPKRSTWILAHVRRSPNLWTLQINVSSMLLRKGYKHSWNLMHTSDSYNQNSTRNYSTRRPPHPPTPRRYRTFEVEVLNRWGRRRDFHSPNPEGKKRNKKQQKFDGISFLTHDCCVPFQGGTGNHWNTINQSITLTHSLTHSFKTHRSPPYSCWTRRLRGGPYLDNDDEHSLSFLSNIIDIQCIVDQVVIMWILFYPPYLLYIIYC